MRVTTAALSAAGLHLQAADKLVDWPFRGQRG
jgi:hypothetical protein